MMGALTDQVNMKEIRSNANESCYIRFCFDATNN